MGKTGLVYHPAYLDHDMGAGHPESPNRLRAIMQHLEQSGMAARLTKIAPRKAEDEWITQVHTPAYVAALHRHAPTSGRVSLDPDTSMSPGSLTAAYLAAGGALAAIDAIMNKQVDHVFCAVRPPGHHAEAGRAMGFCLFNNVAVAAKAALKAGVRRVAIVDWDLHHGNGTQHIFEGDPDVLYLSMHEYPYYPGTGAVGEVGGGAARGRTVNVAWPPGMGDAEYLAAFDRVLLPIARAFDPELVLVSCGFDAAAGDPLGAMKISAAGYGAMTERVCSIAEGRVVLSLEGGYNLHAISAAAAACTAALLGDGAPPVDPEPPNAAAEHVLREVVKAQRPFWPVLG